MLGFNPLHPIIPGQDGIILTRYIQKYLLGSVKFVPLPPT